MNFPSFLRIATAATFCAFAFPVLAQEAPQKALEDANKIYIDGNYPDAVSAYEKILKDYPTATIIPNAQIQLAYAYYLTGQNQESLNILKKLFSGPAPGPEISELGALLEPQALSGLAASLKTDDPKRKELFLESAKQFSNFIQKFPKSGEIESAFLGRAIALFQASDFTGAKESLETNIKRFSNSPGIDDSRNLLALILATEGSQLLSKENPDRDAAFALYDKSVEILRDIIQRKNDLALVNTAQFQLGEILLNQAAYAPDDRKPALLEEAREAFRGVLPKSSIIELQEKKISNIPALRRAALLARNQAELARIDRQAERDRRKLAELQSREDQTVIALEKVGEAYFQQGQYDEARTVLAHAGPLLAANDKDSKKLNLYYTAMSYALQNAADRAIKRYDEFQSAYKGDPIAANLPVAMGNLFLSHPDPAVRNPEQAAVYFKEAAELYPKSPLLSLSIVNEATARAQQGDFDGALKTYQEFLATNPPPEVAVVAQIGIGNVYKDQNKWDDAIAAYKLAAETYPQTPQAEEGQFWIAVGTQQKGDNEAALPLIEAFLQAHPDSPLAASALYAKGAAFIALGRNDEGVATFAQVAEKFPDSQPAPFSYFDRARLAGAAQNGDEVVRLMREFTEKYPNDDKIFFAYDSIGQTEINRADIPAAIKAYEDYVKKYPSSPKAPESMLKIADFQRMAAERLGRYGALPPEDQTQWKANLNAALATGENMVATYPDSPVLGLGLRSLLAAKQLELDAELIDSTAIEGYFQDLANKAPESAKSKVLFARAAFINMKEPARALEEMKKAYDPSIIYAPNDLDIYGIALLDSGKIDEAEAIFQKIAADSPNPDGVPVEQAPPAIQEAQAIALFGLGRVAQAKGDSAAAGELFEKLKVLYPWSPKMLEANYGIAQSMFEQGKGDEAIGLLTQIIRAPNASSQLRADAMLLGGKIQKAKGQNEAAIDYFIKISAFYDGVPEAASEGLWEGALLLEKQVAELQASNPDKAKKQRTQLIRALQELTQKFPDSKFVAQAKEKLSALGVK